MRNVPRALGSTLVLCLVLAVVPAGTAVLAAEPEPLTCAGYPSPRLFVDSQAWWTQTPGTDGSDFGHIHTGACIPERETPSAPEPSEMLKAPASAVTL